MDYAVILTTVCNRRPGDRRKPAGRCGMRSWISAGIPDTAEKIPSAIAMDVRKGPLSRAQEHIRQYGLEEYIQTRLSDGLEGLKAGEGDTLVIAGMGGPLMERILTDGRSVRNSFSELILQPQSDIPHFRRFIQSEGWEITEEKMVEEDGKFYPMMRVVPGENVHSSLKLNVDSFQKNRL